MIGLPTVPITMNIATSRRAARSVKAARRPVWPAWTADTTATRSWSAFSIARSAANSAVTCPKAQLPLTSAVLGVSSSMAGRAVGTISPARTLWTYSGIRRMPCESCPARWLSTSTSATRAARSSGAPVARKIAAVRRWRSAALSVGIGAALC